MVRRYFVHKDEVIGRLPLVRGERVGFDNPPDVQGPARTRHCAIGRAGVTRVVEGPAERSASVNTRHERVSSARSSVRLSGAAIRRPILRRDRPSPRAARS
jgi:hypothetical protein